MATNQAGYQPILRELLHLYPALMSAGTSPKVRSGYQRSAYLGHGWFMRCQRSVEALLLLDDAGYAVEAAPIRRSIIEHNLALRWFACEGDTILDTVIGGHLHVATRQLAAVRQADWASVDKESITDIVAAMQSKPRDTSNDRLLTFTNRLADYGDVHILPGYLAENAQAHPGHESASSYVHLLLNEDAPAKPADPIGQIPFATAHLLEACLAFGSVFDPPIWEDTLNQLTDRYQQATDADRAAKGLPVIDWGTGLASGESA